jgi:beta-lactamase regulating signal transducer with metallopeptidase domain
MSNNNQYIDQSGIIYNKCNLTVNGEEYYNKSLEKVGTLVSIPFIISMILCSLLFILILSSLGVSIYNNNSNVVTTINTTRNTDGTTISTSTSDVAPKSKFSAGLIIVIICCLCCYSSLITNIFNLVSANKKLKLKSKEQQRPCYSDKQHKIIE